MDFTGSGPFNHSDANDVVYGFIIEISDTIGKELATPALDAIDLPEIHTKLGILLSYLRIPIDPCVAKDDINLSEWKKRIELCFSEPDRWGIAGWPDDNKDEWKSGILKTLEDIEQRIKMKYNQMH